MFPDFKAASEFARHFKTVITECRTMEWKQLSAFTALVCVVLGLPYLFWLSIPEGGKQAIIYGGLSLAAIWLIATMAKAFISK